MTYLPCLAEVKGEAELPSDGILELDRLLLLLLGWSIGGSGGGGGGGFGFSGLGFRSGDGGGSHCCGRI